MKQKTKRTKKKKTLIACFSGCTNWFLYICSSSSLLFAMVNLKWSSDCFKKRTVAVNLFYILVTVPKFNWTRSASVSCDSFRNVTFWLQVVVQSKLCSLYLQDYKHRWVQKEKRKTGRKYFFHWSEPAVESDWRVAEAWAQVFTHQQVTSRPYWSEAGIFPGLSWSLD